MRSTKAICFFILFWFDKALDETHPKTYQKQIKTYTIIEVPFAVLFLLASK